METVGLARYVEALSLLMYISGAKFGGNEGEAARVKSHVRGSFTARAEESHSRPEKVEPDS